MGYPCVQRETKSQGSSRSILTAARESVRLCVLLHELPSPLYVGLPEKRMPVDVVVSRLSACQSGEVVCEPFDFFW